MIQGTVPRKTVRTDIDDPDPKQAVKAFLAEYPDAHLERYDGVFVKGLTFCGKPVLEPDKSCKYIPDPKRYTCGCSVCTATVQDL